MNCNLLFSFINLYLTCVYAPDFYPFGEFSHFKNLFKLMNDQS